MQLYRIPYVLPCTPVQTGAMTHDHRTEKSRDGLTGLCTTATLFIETSACGTQSQTLFKTCIISPADIFRLYMTPEGVVTCAVLVNVPV